MVILFIDKGKINLINVVSVVVYAISPSGHLLTVASGSKERRKKFGYCLLIRLILLLYPG